MELTVMTWNLRGSGRPDIAVVVDHARAMGVDVLALQEVKRRQARAIADGLGARSRAWGFKHWPLRTWPEGMAVIGLSHPARVWTQALSYPFRLWSWRRRIYQIAGLDIGGLTITLVNVHLSPHSRAAMRDREAVTILDALSPAPHPVVAGDLNARPDADLFGRFRQAGFRDAWADRHPGDEAGGATNWRRWRRGTTEPPTQRLDYVWVPADIEVTGVSVPRPNDDGFDRFAQLSDHLPLIATLSFAAD